MSQALRIIVYDSWADRLEAAGAHLDRRPGADLSAHLAPGAEARVRRMAELDRDWYGEVVRCFAHLQHPELAFREAWVTGNAGWSELARRAETRPVGENWWIVFVAQLPQKLGPALAPLLAFLRRRGVRIAYYAFDEASRTMPCFTELAPHLDLLIHDEDPLDEVQRGRLPPDCLTLHRSWVANVLPGAAPFNEQPEKRIYFLGSQLGLTDHRRRQIEHLQQRFRDRFVASHDLSLGVGDRFSVNRYQASLCPEGRKFTTPAMSRSHTDRPFWSGCLGMVPVCEDSREGGRLEELARERLILRYPHGDLAALAAACEEALETSPAERRRIYDHFNRQETVGAVLAGALARVHAEAALTAAR